MSPPDDFVSTNVEITSRTYVQKFLLLFFIKIQDQISLFLKIIQTDVLTRLLTKTFSLSLFLISWKDEVYGCLLGILFFMEHVYLKLQWFQSQKPQNFQKNLTDQLKMSPFKRKYSLYQSVFLVDFSENNLKY